MGELEELEMPSLACPEPLDKPAPSWSRGPSGTKAAMKFVDEFRDASGSNAGGGDAPRHTAVDPDGNLRRARRAASAKFGIDELLPPLITLVHGPGCPVCVMPAVELTTPRSHWPPVPT